MKLCAVAAVGALLAPACNTGGCYDNQSAIPLAEFLEKGTDKALTVSGVKIYGIGAPHDSVLVSTTESRGQVYLPMRSTKSSTGWCFEFVVPDDTIPVADTLVFEYESIPFFASEECGAMYYYRIQHYRYTRHVIDSVAVRNDSLITNADIPSIAIYFAPAAQEPEPDPEAGAQ